MTDRESTPPAQAPTTARNRPPGLSRLSLFALLYAWANILHQLSYPEWIMGGHVIGWLLFASSAALALKPTSTSLFVCTLALRLAYTLEWMPMLREHLFLEGMLTLGILLGLGVKARKLRQYKGFGATQQEELFESFAPFLRASSLIVYGAVTICKLNSQFLDPAMSESVNLLLSLRISPLSRLAPGPNSSRSGQPYCLRAGFHCCSCLVGRAGSGC